jgi:hypothetical protein
MDPADHLIPLLVPCRGTCLDGAWGSAGEKESTVGTCKLRDSNFSPCVRALKTASSPDLSSASQHCK